MSEFSRRKSVLTSVIKKGRITNTLRYGVMHKFSRRLHVFHCFKISEQNTTFSHYSLPCITCSLVSKCLEQKWLSIPTGVGNNEKSWRSYFFRDSNSQIFKITTTVNKIWLENKQIRIYFSESKQHIKIAWFLHKIGLASKSDFLSVGG